MAYLVRDLGDPDYKKIPPSSISEFRDLGPNEDVHLPEIPENRTCTNVFFLFPAALLVFGWIGFSIYMTQVYDVRRFSNGEDKCGNICGVKNTRVTGEGCEANDYTDFPIAWYGSEEIHCAKKCKGDDRMQILNRCVLKKSVSKDADKLLESGGTVRKDVEDKDEDPKILVYVVFAILLQNWYMIFGVVLLAMILSYLLLLGFRYCTACIFWTCIVLMGIVIVSLTILAWYGYSMEKSWSLLLAAVLITVILIVYIIFLFYLFKFSHHVIVAVIQEASIAIFKIPVSLLAPIMSIVFIYTVVYGFSFYMIMVLLSPSKPTMPTINSVYIYFWLATTYFLLTLVTGCQCMVVAGSVASYYFARDKTSVGNHAFCVSLYVTVVYHLGTICAVALLLTILEIIKMMLRSLESRARRQGTYYLQIIAHIMVCCCSCIQEIIEYIAKKAFIMTAIHGKGLIDSGKRAMRLIWRFLMDTIVLDCVVHFTISTAAMFIIVISVAVAYAMVVNLFYFLLVFLIPVVLLVGVAVYCITSLLNVAIETIFLCMLEDITMNDGSSQRPYFMTQNLATVKTMLFAYIQGAHQLREQRRQRREAEERQNQQRDGRYQDPYQRPPQGQNPYQYGGQPHNQNTYQYRGQPQTQNPYQYGGQPQTQNPYQYGGQPQNQNPYQQRGQSQYGDQNPDQPGGPQNQNQWWI